jgi:hypothetical protein
MEYINKVNNPDNGYMWTARVYDDFVGKSYDQMRKLLGGNNFMKGFESEESNNPSFLEMSIKV